MVEEEGRYALPVRSLSFTYNWAVRMAWRLLGASGDRNKIVVCCYPVSGNKALVEMTSTKRPVSMVIII